MMTAPRPSRSLRRLVSTQATGMGSRGSALTRHVQAKVEDLIEVHEATVYFDALGDEDRVRQCLEMEEEIGDELIDDLQQLLIEVELPRTARAWALGALTSITNWRQHRSELVIFAVRS